MGCEGEEELEVPPLYSFLSFVLDCLVCSASVSLMHSSVISHN
jgi:hypothetical protein